jgi:hypothetical protein
LRPHAVAEAAIGLGGETGVAGVTQGLEVRALIGAALATREDVVHVGRRLAATPAVGLFEQDLLAELAPS